MLHIASAWYDIETYTYQLHRYKIKSIQIKYFDRQVSRLGGHGTGAGKTRGRAREQARGGCGDWHGKRHMQPNDII